MNLQRKTWIQVIGITIGSYVAMDLVFSLVALPNEYFERILQGLILFVIFLLVGRVLIPNVEGSLSPVRLFSRNTLESLKFSIPALVLLLPAIFFRIGDAYLVSDWKIYLIEDLIHSSFLEELVFRAIIFCLLLKTTSSRRAASFSAVLFAFTHLNRVFRSHSEIQLMFNLFRVFDAGIAGYCLAILYKRFNFNLWVPILFHFVTNGIGLFTAQENPIAIAINFTGIIISFAWIIRVSLHDSNTESKDGGFVMVPANGPLTQGNC